MKQHRSSFNSRVTLSCFQEHFQRERPLLFNYICFHLILFDFLAKSFCKRIDKQQPTLINKQMTVEIVYCSVRSQLNEINVIKRQILSLRTGESCWRTKVSEPTDH